MRIHKLMSSTRRMYILSLTLAITTAICLTAGCVEKRRSLTSSERARAQVFVSRQPPSPAVRVDAEFEHGVKLLGYTVQTPSPKSGGELKFTLFWHTANTLPQGTRIFSHLLAGQQYNADTEGDVVKSAEMRDLYQPDNWRKGEYVRDPITLVVPSGFAGTLKLFVGMWNIKTEQRYSVSRGPKDAENRVPTLNLRVSAASAEELAAELPSLTVAWAHEPPKLDGELNELFWQQAGWSSTFVNTLSGGPAGVPAKVKAAWDKDNLYIGFSIDDTYLIAPATAHDAHLWENDCAEIMLDPDGDGKNYFEMQVSPTGVSFDTRYDARRVPGPHGHTQWESKLKSGVAPRGKVNDNGDDQGYTVEFMIPFTGLTGHHAPKAGDIWRANFYALDKRRQGAFGSGWSAPKVGDYHVPARFGRLIFAAPSDLQAAAAITSPQAPSSAQR